MTAWARLKFKEKFLCSNRKLYQKICEKKSSIFVERRIYQMSSYLISYFSIQILIRERIFVRLDQPIPILNIKNCTGF